MNRIILIGNGFDLAHKLPTRYEDFMDWYWEFRVNSFWHNRTNTDADCLCSFKIKNYSNCEAWSGFAFCYCHRILNPIPGSHIIASIIQDPEHYETTFSPFLRNICESIETKGWVDIENEYYRLLTKYSLISSSADNETAEQLNNQLCYLKDKLAQYLSSLKISESALNEEIRKKIYSPININDISVDGMSSIENHCSYWLARDDKEWESRLSEYKINSRLPLEEIAEFKKTHASQIADGDMGIEDCVGCPKAVLLPNRIMLLNFNYSEVADRYAMNPVSFTNHIHGDLSDPQKMIFGYGDELDDTYSSLLKLEDNECLRHIKSIKYLESDNYRKMLSFIESEPYQVFIMGHSCGNSDRTLLNTLFEHKNCVSIKPFYYRKDDGTDNYLELAQNICKNFTDMKLMRDRVVNKTYCEPLPQTEQ